ncbi:hypothetical protein CN189_21735 [Sinorhizobium meliloti]|nr:hypothetical protein CN189_21735 [Sinorhizobium meliloti]
MNFPRTALRLTGRRSKRQAPVPLQSGARQQPRVPFAPLAGRRWPAGRMRGDSKRSGYEISWRGPPRRRARQVLRDPPASVPPTRRSRRPKFD